MAIKTLLAGATHLGQSASYLEGSVPTTGDILVIRDGNQRITDGLNLTATPLNGIHKIGSAAVTFAAPIEVDVDNGSDPKIIDNSAGGDLWVDGDVTALWAMRGRGRVKAAGGAWATILAMMQNVDVSDQVSLGAVWAQQANLNIASHASDRIDSLNMLGGTVYTERDVESGNIGGAGTLTFARTAKINDGSGTGNLVINGDPQRLLVQILGNAALTFDNMLGISGRITAEGSAADITFTAGTTSPLLDIVREFSNGEISITSETKIGVPGFFFNPGPLSATA